MMVVMMMMMMKMMMMSSSDWQKRAETNSGLPVARLCLAPSSMQPAWTHDWDLCATLALAVVTAGDASGRLSLHLTHAPGAGGA